MNKWTDMMYNPKKYIPKMYKPFWRYRIRTYKMIVKYRKFLKNSYNYIK